MATTLWIRSGDTQLRKTAFGRAYSTATGKGATSEFYEGGTTTPLTVFADSLENTPVGATVQVDSDARWPNVFVPTGNSFDFIIRDFDGGIISQSVNVPNPDPAAQSGPAPTNFITGMVIWMQQNAPLSLWVRCNGGTIGRVSGSESSGDDKQDLFEFIWNNSTQDTNPVSGGVRGASATADWLADKEIQLPDMRGGGPIGLDGMGQPAGGFFTDVSFTTGNATQPGSLAGVNSAAITIAQLPAHAHDFGTLATANESDHTHGVGTYDTSTTGSGHSHPLTDPKHSHGIANFNNTTVVGGVGISVKNQNSGATAATTSTESTGITVNANTGTHDHTIVGISGTGAAHNHDITGATASIGGGEFHSSVSRAVLGTWFQKL